jgi:HlyD family secretion protein
VTVASKVEGTTTIISIVPEGTQVNEGDLLVELDASVLVETEKTQVIAVTQADAALKKAQESLAIQKRQNESDIAAADLALVLADLDLDKYQNGEYPQLVNEQKGLVQVAQEELARAKEVYEFSQRLAQKGYTSQNELEANRISMTKAEIDLAAAQDKLRVLVDYTKERTIRELTEKAAEAIRARERVERQGIATLAQFEADVKAAELTLKVEQEKLQRAQTQIANSKLYAPQAGEVVYVKEDDRRGDGSMVIMEGATIRERQELIKLPNLAEMKVDAKVHESLISRIREGLPVRIRVDAVPGIVFTGKVLSISSVPLSGDWMRPDLREYECIISIDYAPGGEVTLKPGLTAEVEIIVQERSDVLQIPFQSILSIGRSKYAFVLTPQGSELRELVIGAANDTHVEILDGVADGEKVILNPRTHFADKLAELEGAAKSEAEAENSGNGPAGGSADAPSGDVAAGGSPEAAGGPAAASPGGQAGGPGAGGPGAGGPPNPAQFFARLDKNSDGGVTQDELPEGMASRFATMDANSDAKVDAVEFAAAAKAFRPPGGGPGGGGPGGGGPGGGGAPQ